MIDLWVAQTAEAGGEWLGVCIAQGVSESCKGTRREERPRIDER